MGQDVLSQIGNLVGGYLYIENHPHEECERAIKGITEALDSIEIGEDIIFDFEEFTSLQRGVLIMMSLGEADTTDSVAFELVDKLVVIEVNEECRLITIHAESI